MEILKRAWEERGHILEGIKNNVKDTFGLLPQELQDVIVERRLICEQCPFNSKNATEQGIYKNERPDEHCILCGCNIHTKTACLDCNCGIEVHNQNAADNLELKWKKYERHQNGETNPL